MKLVVLPDAEYKKIRELISERGVVLMPESLADKHDRDNLHNAVNDYDFGGEADVWADFVDSDDHFFLSELKDGSKEKGGGQCD